MNRHFLFTLLCFILMINGCTKSKPVKMYQDKAAKANQLMKSGHSKQAALLYQRLADQESPYQNQFRLLAAEAFLNSGDGINAANYIQAINPAKLPPRQRYRFYLIDAQISLSFADAERAITSLDSIPLGQLNAPDRAAYHQSRAFVYSLLGEDIKSSKERIQLSRYLHNPQQISNNNNAILNALLQVPVASLKRQQTPPPDILGGWITLALLLKLQDQNRAELASELIAWRRSYPGHPANSNFLDEYLARTQPLFKIPEVIAVFLPESGPYALAANAIREGLVAARDSGQNYDFNPLLRFYDSEASEPGILYQQAIKDGAQFIIGPLNKNHMTRLLETSELDIPVLALNFVPELSHYNLYQFGLSPIDDVQDVTTKAKIDGHQKALILVPDSTLGQRIGEYYNHYWQQNEGTILKNVAYNPKENDFSTPIKQLLNLGESNDRYQKIRQLVPAIKHTPRRRHDVDAIFIHASPNTARLLNPQLHFYRATRVPVYATHHLYSGHAQPARDIDLNGITFCDIPWLFNKPDVDNATAADLEPVEQPHLPPYPRLYAMGLDAYNLIPHLADMGVTPYPGATGNLSLTDNKRIKRHLICAEFSNGSPLNLGYIDNVEMTNLPEIKEEAIRYAE